MITTKKKSFIQQFFDFIKSYDIIGLAIAYIVGKSVTDLVEVIVNDIINPFIGLFLSADSLDKASIKVTSLAG